MIYLFRHGEIESCGERRYLGQTDLPLAEKGMERAKTWGKWLSGFDFRAIYSSDLQRARLTAELMSGEGARIIISPLLREISLGEWENEKMSHIRAVHPEEWRKRGEDMEGYRPPGGESFADLQNRVVPFFQEIAQSEGDILVVAHAGVNRAILCHILKIPLKNLFKIGQDYCAMNVINKIRDGFKVSALNVSYEVMFSKER